ncbi:MAG: 50S ribosomal protein L29 [Tenuifilaceae bacterium]|jgi:large subunit ribosomal protein L29|nr:50S ribosomal protein L29 [Bacteroidales bacterium]MDI9515513.1 50S ribosomal protein L29 [Bacteroidota bacterium]NLH56236.1 50S ribosomal protein L29 [Rikenellaceae bacterium]OQC63616.1 MAG: 50S ribosomal protein L29 [Bacteroidetes bacterium ADurb.Bin008]HNV81130.1 50S ribosomal protein L29 [Tenuifilaceae bacterium]
MKPKEIRELSVKELEERIETTEAQLQKLRMNHAVSPLDNPMKLKEMRKTIARMKTILSERTK